MLNHLTRDTKTPDFIRGEIIIFDKAKTWTSFNVVNKVRNRICKKYGLKKIKVGHAGTLDPLATGLLILTTGKYTKLIEEIQQGEKIYEAVFCLGATTPSFDLEKEILLLLRTAYAPNTEHYGFYDFIDQLGEQGKDIGNEFLEILARECSQHEKFKALWGFFVSLAQTSFKDYWEVSKYNILEVGEAVRKTFEKPPAHIKFIQDSPCLKNAKVELCDLAKQIQLLI